jgi:hypothetical protein
MRAHDLAVLIRRAIARRRPAGLFAKNPLLRPSITTSSKNIDRRAAGLHHVQHTEAVERRAVLYCGPAGDRW